MRTPAAVLGPISSFILSTTAITIAIPGSVCDDADVQYFWPLSSEPYVQQFCTESYPLPVVTAMVTVTSTVDTTATIPVTVPEASTTVITGETITVLVTRTETDTVTETSTMVATSTSHPPDAAKVKRSKGCKRAPSTSISSISSTSSSESSSPTSSSGDLLSSFLTAAPSIASAFCSCFGTPATTTSTNTISITSEIPVETTITEINVATSTDTGMFISTAVETITTTTTTSITTTAVATAPPTCAGVEEGGVFTATNGNQYSVKCGAAYKISNNIINTAITADFAGCINLCSVTTGCVAVNYDRTWGGCHALNANFIGYLDSYPAFDRALLVAG